MQPFFSGNDVNGTGSDRTYRLLASFAIAIVVMLAAGVDNRSHAQSAGIGANKTGQSLSPEQMEQPTADQLSTMFKKLMIEQPDERKGKPASDETRKKLRDMTKDKR
jgi:hypothetical protein